MDQHQYKRKGGLSGPLIRPSRAPQDNRQPSDLLDLPNSDLIRIRLNISEFGRSEVQHCPPSPVVTGCSNCPVKLSSTKSRRTLTGKGDRMRADGTGPMDLVRERTVQLELKLTTCRRCTGQVARRRPPIVIPCAIVDRAALLPVQAQVRFSHEH